MSIEFNPVRVGFKTDTSQNTKNPGFEVYVNDILNLGVRPDRLIELMKSKYESLGGSILENTSLSRVDVYSDVAHLNLSSKVRSFTPAFVPFNASEKTTKYLFPSHLYHVDLNRKLLKRVWC